MDREDVTFEVVLVGGHVVAEVAGEAPPLVHRLHVHPAHTHIIIINNHTRINTEEKAKGRHSKE